MKKRLEQALVGLVVLGGMTSANAAEPSRRPLAPEVLLTTVAVVANVTPVVSSVYAPQCLPGYVFCKALFASVSVLAAVDHLVLSGGADSAQTRAILHRGFAGDWLLTARHIAGEDTAQPLPEPPPPVSEGDGGWQPPPL
jgi:hypothetical protein